MRFNKLNISELNNQLSSRSFKSELANTNFTSFFTSDNWKLTSRKKRLEDKLHSLKKRKEAFTFKMPSQAELLKYKTMYPGKSKSISKGVYFDTERSKSYQKTLTEPGQTSRNNKYEENVKNTASSSKMFLKSIITQKFYDDNMKPRKDKTWLNTDSDLRFTLKPVVTKRFNNEEYELNKQNQENMKKIEKLKQYNRSVRQLENFKSLFKTRQIKPLSKHPKKNLMQNFALKKYETKIIHRKQKMKPTLRESIQPPEDRQKQAEAFFLTEFPTFKENYPDAISILKDDPYVAENVIDIGKLREQLKPTGGRAMLAPVNATLEKIYRTDEHFETKIKEAKMNKGLPLDVYQNNLLKLCYNTMSPERFNNLKGRFNYIGRLTERVKKLPPFHIDQIFNVENFKSELHDLADQEPKKKRRSKLKSTNLKLFIMEEKVSSLERKATEMNQEPI